MESIDPFSLSRVEYVCACANFQNEKRKEKNTFCTVQNQFRDGKTNVLKCDHKDSVDKKSESEKCAEEMMTMTKTEKNKETNISKRLRSKR